MGLLDSMSADDLNPFSTNEGFSLNAVQVLAKEWELAMGGMPEDVFKKITWIANKMGIEGVEILDSQKEMTMEITFEKLCVLLEQMIDPLRVSYIRSIKNLNEEELEELARMTSLDTNRSRSIMPQIVLYAIKLLQSGSHRITAPITGVDFPKLPVGWRKIEASLEDRQQQVGGFLDEAEGLSEQDRATLTSIQGRLDQILAKCRED
jgi:hypothetical protein